VSSTDVAQVRSGADYLESLDDGRRIWVDGEEIDDIRTHPATAGVVAEHARWYDRHRDPEWSDRLLNADGHPIAFTPPRSGEDLRKLMDGIVAVAFESAGNITHDPGYGALITLGARNATGGGVQPERSKATAEFYDKLTATGQFAAAPYAPVIGDRFLPPGEALKPTVVEERDDGVVVRGAVGLGTGLPYANYVYTAPPPGPLTPQQAIWFAVSPGTEGVRLVARQPSGRGPSRKTYPLSSRYDELESTLILDDVLVPWESVFIYGDVELSNHEFDGSVMWLAFHHLCRILARAEFTLGLSLAVCDSLATIKTPGVQSALIDQVFYLETIKAALIASCADAQISEAGFAFPEVNSLGGGTVFALDNRAKVADAARTLAGFGSMLSPVQAELEDSVVGPWLKRTYGGGGWTAEQRASLLHVVREHLASGLDSREAAFEALASGGKHLWRLRMRMAYPRFEELANRVVGAVDELDAPELSFDSLRQLGPK
jgi:4-hydroxyphenylacetate 3-monooxygenase